MEQLITYESAKHLVVYTGYYLILAIDIWFIIFIIMSAFKWITRKIKSFKSKFKSDTSDETTQKQ